MNKQKVWFITGASKGMGLEITKAVLNNGDKVIVTSRNTGTLLEKIIDYTGNLLPIKLDITKEKDVENAISKGIAKFGGIDVVVNNVGYNLLGNIEELSDTEFRETMNVNVFTMANIIRKLLPHLRKQNSGPIINTTSMMGYMSDPGNISYSASKYAVSGNGTPPNYHQQKKTTFYNLHTKLSDLNTLIKKYSLKFVLSFSN
ncbi:MAG: SDR family NAD(P)-dependent oxidoreductase [Chitinophagaceae bacterium]|nr:SDR family NAD(P)-dependent oxidoreductase [Chitinophagaceae bacterium]